MLKPRKARGIGVSVEAWFYINPSSIEVHIHTENHGVSCSLTRRQLQQALAIMDEYVAN
jgi:hypothetical protein